MNIRQTNCMSYDEQVSLMTCINKQRINCIKVFWCSISSAVIDSYLFYDGSDQWYTNTVYEPSRQEVRVESFGTILIK